MILSPKQKPSFGIEELLREKFTYKESLPGPTARTYKTVDTRDLSVADPQPIYTSTINALLAGRLLADAYLSGWQYVLISGEQPQGVIEVSDKPAGGESPMTFDVLRSREYAEAMNNVIRHAEEIEGEYDLRILRVPAIYLLAVWLQAGRENWLLPLVPPSSQSLMGGIFSEGDLAKKLEHLASKRRDTPDRGDRRRDKGLKSDR